MASGCLAPGCCRCCGSRFVSRDPAAAKATGSPSPSPGPPASNAAPPGVVRPSLGASRTARRPGSAHDHGAPRASRRHPSAARQRTRRTPRSRALHSPDRLPLCRGHEPVRTRWHHRYLQGPDCRRAADPAGYRRRKRGLRPYADKSTAEIHDYYDELTGVLASSLAKRAPGYTSLGFPDPRKHPYTSSVDTTY